MLITLSDRMRSLGQLLCMSFECQLSSGCLGARRSAGRTHLRVRVRRDRNPDCLHRVPLTWMGLGCKKEIRTETFGGSEVIRTLDDRTGCPWGG